jgi:hypothetical protein
MEKIPLQELSLIPTAYKTSTTITDPLLSFARRLQTLLITEPFSNPAALEMGVGIGFYLHEIANNTTKVELTDRISYQINKFLPNDVVISTNVEFIDNPSDATGGKTLVVFFSLSYKYGKTSIAISFSNPSNTSTITSDIYF